MSHAGAVVLAAGASARFGGPKQVLLLPFVLERLGDVPLEQIVVVVGAHELALADAPRVDVVRCDDWASGPGASLRAGLAALGPDVEVAVVVLADGPLIAPAAIERVIARWRADPGELVAASYAGVRGHPVALGRALWERIPDDGGRCLAATLVPCDDLGSPGDIDTQADLAALFARLGGA
jgi:CTP:molybdopterin cytidylyltransferase MocA